MIKQLKNKKNEVIQEIDELKKKITYTLCAESSQRKHYKKIHIRGFTKLPSGFYKEGYGLSRDGQYVLRAITEHLASSFNLEFKRIGKSSVSKRRGIYTISFNHEAYSGLLEKLRTERIEKNKIAKDITLHELSKWFPKHFKPANHEVERSFSYNQDKISKILNSEENIEEKLSKNDITKILEIYPKLVSRYTNVETSIQKLSLINSSKKQTDKLVLGSLIKEFNRRLKKSTQSENEWQEFLQKHILLFNTSYVAVLGKTSVALQGKYPDFMLIDVFNYIDIFEIKKPNTNLLKLDESRNNYFWDSEISKAISQTENYINSLSTNGPTFSSEIRKLKNLQVNVVKPRGIIIVGTREQLKTEKMKDDFRLLQSSLSNLDIILFDDLLNRLKNLQNRLSK